MTKKPETSPSRGRHTVYLPQFFPCREELGIIELVHIVELNKDLNVEEEQDSCVPDYRKSGIILPSKEEW